MAIIPDQGGAINDSGMAPAGLAPQPPSPFHFQGFGNAPAAPWARLLAGFLGRNNPDAAVRMLMAGQHPMQQAPIAQPMPAAPMPLPQMSGAVPQPMAPVMQPRPELLKAMAPPVMPQAPVNPAAPPMPAMHPEIARRLAALAAMHGGAQPMMGSPAPMPTTAGGGFGMPTEARNPFANPQANSF